MELALAVARAPAVPVAFLAMASVLSVPRKLTIWRRGSSCRRRGLNCRWRLWDDSSYLKRCCFQASKVSGNNVRHLKLIRRKYFFNIDVYIDNVIRVVYSFCNSVRARVGLLESTLHWIYATKKHVFRCGQILEDERMIIAFSGCWDWLDGIE